MNQNRAALDQQLDPTLVRQALDLIAPAQRIALLAHEGPDGDCIGSALGLTHSLQAVGKTCVPACADPPPRYLSFLPGVEMFAQDLGDETFDLVIALDANELYRFGQLHERHQDFLARARILNIDHHLNSNGGCGQVNIVDTSAAATAELLVLFQQQAGLPLPAEAALCLLTGLMTDSGSFQFTNTTPRTLEVAAELLRQGAVPETIAQPVFREHTLAQARFQAAIIDQARTGCEGRLIWSWSNDETLARTGVGPEDNNASGLLRDITGVQIAVVFKSYGTPNVTRMSMRTIAPYDGAELCKRLSNGQGGGHARAAGATINLPLHEAMAFVVAELEKVLQHA
jgi:bifunctional oligoribonuclease and PAP phosphatase NrnA